MKTLVLGIGNTLVGDDGVGVHVARAVASQVHRKDVAVEETAAAGLNLLDHIVGYDRLIIIDAIITENDVGKIYRLGLVEVGKPSGLAIVHTCGLSNAVELSKKLYPDKAPKEVVIFAVGIKSSHEITEQMSPAVQAAVPEVVSRVLAEIQK